jgi:hypothetical protein
MDLVPLEGWDVRERFLIITMLVSSLLEPSILETMIEENRQLITNEPVEFEK